MDDKSLELRICPKCGSTEYLENFPAPGLSICAECGQETILIHLREMPEEEIIQQPCPSCGKEGEEDDTLLDQVIIIVYKCKRCGTLYGYRVALEPPDGIGPAPRQHSLKPKKKQKPVSLYKLEGYKPVYSAEDAERLAKLLKNAENDPKEKNKRKLELIIFKIHRKMERYGIAQETISRARWKVSCFIEREGPFTEKQLQSQFSAAISLAQDDLIKNGGFYGKRITQRQMKEIFNVDRKTIRKWRNKLSDTKPKRPSH
jgi:DNA-directed RNA polymerase subunit RPC12/RpoP